MFRIAIRKHQGDPAHMEFHLHVRNDNSEGEPPLVTLQAVCGPVDIDDPLPAITIMLPDED
jgi:hypothetical protein